MRDTSVLFIDDNVISALEACEFLRDHGFTVIEAGNSADAFEAIDTHPELQALITDIELGETKDGFDVARHARAVRAQLPVVYISGTAAARHPHEGVGGSEFVAKPLHPQQIIEALGRVIERKVA